MEFFDIYIDNFHSFVYRTGWSKK